MHAVMGNAHITYARYRDYKKQPGDVPRKTLKSNSMDSDYNRHQ